VQWLREVLRPLRGGPATRGHLVVFARSGCEDRLTSRRAHGRARWRSFQRSRFQPIGSRSATVFPCLVRVPDVNRTTVTDADGTLRYRVAECSTRTTARGRRNRALIRGRAFSVDNS
jgi:hypothetical protein